MSFLSFDCFLPKYMPYLKNYTWVFAENSRLPNPLPPPPQKKVFLQNPVVVVVVVVVVTPNFFTVGGEGAQEGDEEGKAEK